MKKYSVKDIMTTKLITITPNDTIGQAQALMKKHKIRQLPVCKNNKILGIITDRDIREIIGSLKLTTESELLNLKKEPIEKFMTLNPVTIKENTPLERAVKLINTKKFGSLPICDDEENLVGIITITDISGFLLKVLQEEA